MKIDELDESQGLTTEMVREWLTAQNATFRNGHWTHPNGKYRYKDGKYGGLLWSLTLSQIAADFGKANEQALLREINPRMRKGMPSEAARDAHDGFWLAIPDFACMGAHAPIVVTFDGDGFGIWHPEGFAFPNSKPKTAHFWHFWPCDEHGNKVRWPTDAEGKML